MSYYRGDYYAGGIGSFFGGLLSSGLSMIPGAGPLLGRISQRVIPAAGSKTGAIASAAGAGMAAVKAGATAVGGAIVKHPVLSAAGAAGAGLAIGAAGEHLMAPGAMAAGAFKGHHMSKPYKCHGTIVPSHLVRNRRMNVANGRALHRAVRRLHGFARKYRKVVGFVSPRKPKGRMYFRKRKSKK